LIVEVIAVGTELLIGQIVNSNASYIGARLAEEGHDAHFQVTVGDNLPRLVRALEVAMSRSDVVVITGGIGPTQDDLTREAMCQVAGRDMTRDESHAAWIERRLGSQGRTMSDTVLRMADLPEGAEGLPNVNGVALGVAMQHQEKWLFALPGVPVEMSAMLDQEVMPRLRRIAGDAAVLRSRILRTWGIGESRVSELVDDLFLSTNPSVAFLITDMEVGVRVSAKAADQETADRLIGPIEEEIRQRLGEAVFGVDDETVEKRIIDALAALGWTVSTLEQATLGQVGARIAATTGSEPVYGGSVIVGPQAGDLVPPSTDVVLSVGAIGPDREPGRRTIRDVPMSVTTPVQETSRVFELGGDDERVRSFATIAGLHMLRVALESTEQP
jgi:nicotinamide-nucleotide amidase